MIRNVTLLLVLFAFGIDLYVVAALIPAIATDLGEPVGAMGILVAGYALPNAALAPVFGPLSDRIGRRLTMLGGMSFFAATVIGTAVAPNLPLLAVLRVLNGLGAAVAVPAVFAYAGDLPTPEERSRSMGNLSMGYPMAALLGLPIGAFIAGATGWRLTFLSVGLLALVATILIARLPADRPKASTAIGYVEGLRFAMADRQVRSVIGVTFLWFLGPTAMITFVSAFFIGAFGLDTSNVGIVFIVLGTVGIVSARTSARFTARIGARRAVLLGIGCFGVAVLALPSMPSLPLALAVFSLWVFGTWFGLPAQQSIAAGISTRARGTVMAFNSSAFNFAAVVSPIVGGLIFSAGGFRLLGTAAAMIAAVAFVLAWVVLPRPVALASQPPPAVRADAEPRQPCAEDVVADCVPV